MREKGKNWMISVAGKALEGLLFGSLNKMRRKYGAMLDGAPVTATRLFYLYAGLILLVAVTAVGALILPVGIILLVVELLSSSVSREVIAMGILFSLLGATYLFGGGAIVYLIGKYIHSSVMKIAKDFSHKPE